ncbi:hypothetical protein D3C80_1725890 [compost metagenome]
MYSKIIFCRINSTRRVGKKLHEVEVLALNKDEFMMTCLFLKTVKVIISRI